jgi:hypothetical protein
MLLHEKKRKDALKAFEAANEMAKEKAAQERERVRGMMGSVANFSQAKRLTKDLLGPLGRVWVREGVVSVGEDSGQGRIIYGEGASFQEALFDACRDLTVEEIMELAGPTMLSLGVQNRPPPVR